MLVHIKKLVAEAEKGGYALGAFNTFNLETTQGIIKGAVAAHSPVIIQVSETSLRYAGVDVISQIIGNLSKSLGKNIQIAIHLDHGRTFSMMADCINLGFSSVMIDASDLSFDKNVFLTRKVADYAHRRNVWVQGELGRVVKNKKEITDLFRSPKEFLTDPDQAQEFVKKTKINTLAVAIGNIHGVYKLEHGAPKLFLERLKEIQKKVRVPLVLHGASKIPESEIKKAIKLGIRIINIDTEIKFAFRRSLAKSFKTKESDPRFIFLTGIEAVSKAVKEKIAIFRNHSKP